ncbi:hypothetical protein LEN26_008419 [Aphanomyces euteiches]|nr:hypothetical protein AeMF1_002693 [Aphanomyces euteiches]KAH9130536.1 hypothetical protein LEN26_008419 [Aphanomyces euteiches]KAH9188670.1 hypothetical protein AeNC1_009360 [Aphanomyces euteiches]
MPSIVEGIPIATEKSNEIHSPRATSVEDDELLRAEDVQAKARVEFEAAARATQLAQERIEQEAAAYAEKLKAEEEASLAAFREELEIKRKQKREAELLHEQKIIEAVCAASLYEFNERQRLEKQLEQEEKDRSVMVEARLTELEATTTAARHSKTSAVQNVLDLKTKAHEAKANARKAIEEYEAKERERQEKLAQLAELEAEHQLQLELEAVKKRQEEATLRRQDSERRAAEAVRRAEEIRQQALNAAKQMRAASKKNLEAVLDKEDQIRQHQYASQLSALHATQEEATRRRLESERRAKEAAQRAEELRQQAIDATKRMRSTAKENLEVVFETEEKLRAQQYESQLSAVRSTQEEAKLKRIELERRAQEAAQKAEDLRREAMNATKRMRSATKEGIEAVLEREERLRQQQYSNQLSAVQAMQEEASLKRQESERRAHEAARKAEEMKQMAIDAAKRVRPSSKEGIEALVAFDVAPPAQQFEKQSSGVQVEKEQETPAPMTSEGAASKSPERTLRVPSSVPSTAEVSSPTVTMTSVATGPPVSSRRSTKTRAGKEKKCAIM